MALQINFNGAVFPENWSEADAAASFEAAQLAEQNDTFRKQLGVDPRIQGRMFITAGICALDEPTRLAAIKAMQEFDSFDVDEDDPHGEHDFGSFKLGEGDDAPIFFWKIDYFDLTYSWGAEDPTDPRRTRRVLTLMLASEY